MDSRGTGSVIDPEEGGLIETNDQDVIDDGDCVWIKDDFPICGPAANELPINSRALIEYFVPIRGVVTDGITFYVYCRSVASWAQMESDSASSELLTVADINAPVNSEKALSKIYPLLRRIAQPIGHLRSSVCIGTRRLKFHVTYLPSKGQSIVNYSEHEEVIENTKGPEHTRMYMFVVSPITMPYPYACPVRITVDFSDKVINTILKPLRDDQKMDFLFRMHRMLVGGDPSVIVFYGPDGHEGKTVLAKNLNRLLAGAVAWSSEDLVGHKSKWPDVDTVMKLCERRVLICDECEIEGGFSYQHIKRWTSNAPVSIGGRTGFLSQTLIVISNKIPFFEKAAVNNSIGRRLVVYDMRKNLEDQAPLPEHAINNKVRMKFVSMCATVGRAYEEPPTSLSTALYTMMRKSINRITAGVGYDPASSREECVEATCTLALRCGVPPLRLCKAMRAISRSTVIMPTYGMPYISCLKPDTRRTLTDKGWELVIKNKGKAVYDLEKLKEVARLI